ncbi:MAG: molybdenum cofactor guanylyltransferase [Actinomycetota bacterium]
MLAGGGSVRFGRDKLAEPYLGMPLLNHAVLRLAAICDDVVVVLAPSADASGLPPGVRPAFDPTPGEGPLAGLQAGLLSAVAADLVIVAGGDMPDLQVPVLREMLRVIEEAGVDAVALADGDRARPLPCALRPASAAGAAHSLLHSGRRRLRDLLDSLQTAVIDTPTWTALDPARRTLFDIDEPGDMDR